MNKPLLIAMMGLPRSGKSTHVKSLTWEYNAPIVSRDALRLAIHGRRYASEAEPMVKTVSLYMIKALFKAGHDVVIYDETNYSRAARDFIKSKEWDTIFFEVPTSPEICIQRAVDTNQPDLIQVIKDMWDRREPLGEDELSYKQEEPRLRGSFYL